MSSFSPAIGRGVSANPRIDLAEASAVRSVAGVPSWAAILIAVVGAGLGAAVDALVSGKLGWGFRVGFVAGIALAALAVRRRSIFTAMVQAPLVMVTTMVVAERILVTERFTFTLIAVVNAFPTMAVGTAVGLALGLIRMLAQPLRSARPVGDPAHV